MAVSPIMQAPLPSSFWLGLANGRHSQEVLGLEETKVGLFLTSSLYGLGYFFEL